MRLKKTLQFINFPYEFLIFYITRLQRYFRMRYNFVIKNSLYVGYINHLSAAAEKKRREKTLFEDFLPFFSGTLNERSAMKMKEEISSEMNRAIHFLWQIILMFSPYFLSIVSHIHPRLTLFYIHPRHLKQLSEE